IGFPVTLPAATTAPAATKVYNATVGSGSGQVNLGMSFSLQIPGRTHVGTYTSTWTFTLATGP
ncbi:MAG: hypothetical protein AAGC46_05970, partial [Solirubrobacteraceae bacterium]|nr:hypothetical protein [Patulibacter sp.]